MNNVINLIVTSNEGEKFILNVPNVSTKYSDVSFNRKEKTITFKIEEDESGTLASFTVIK